MSAKILSGKEIREARMNEMKKRVSELFSVPRLAIIQVGNRIDSTTFIKAKKSFADKIGIEVEHFSYPENISEVDLISEIEKMNGDEKITGIIVQLPLPLGLDRDKILNTIDPKKDADGLTASNVQALSSGRNDAILPATARGIRELFNFYNIDLFGKNITVVGRSSLVGRPVASMCINENATVTICHSKTRELARFTKSADILIVAIGKPRFIGREYIKEGQIVVDIGINKIDGVLSGDVDFENVKDIVDAMTPVPGGVGPMTVLGLFENVLDLATQ